MKVAIARAVAARVAAANVVAAKVAAEKVAAEKAVAGSDSPRANKDTDGAGFCRPFSQAN